MVPRIELFEEFMEIRHDAQGKSLRSRFGLSQGRGDGWFYFANNAFSRDRLPSRSEGPHAHHGAPEYETFLHGSES